MNSVAFPQDEAGHSTLAIALSVPPPWREAVERTTAALCAEFPESPVVRFQPHISLCQSFLPLPGARALLIRQIERVLLELPVGAVRVGGVASFAAHDGSPEVLYLAVESEWLRLAHRRLVRATAPYRWAQPPDLPPPGNPAFDLDGYTPHITLLFTRETVRGPDRAAAAHRATALWASLRPAGDGFTAAEVTISSRRLETDPITVSPHVLQRWQLVAGRARADHPR